MHRADDDRLDPRSGKRADADPGCGDADRVAGAMDR
jgi:hypothetical protein